MPESTSSKSTVTAYPTHTPCPAYTSESEPIDAPQPPSTPTPTNMPTRLPRLTDTIVPTPEFECTEARIVEVVDGDTIKVEIDGDAFAVRYIGIDTPETVSPGKPIEGASQSEVHCPTTLAT